MNTEGTLRATIDASPAMMPAAKSLDSYRRRDGHRATRLLPAPTQRRRAGPVTRSAGDRSEKCPTAAGDGCPRTSRPATRRLTRSTPRSKGSSSQARTLVARCPNSARPIPRGRPTSRASSKCRSSRTRPLAARCPTSAPARYHAAGFSPGHPGSAVSPERTARDRSTATRCDLCAPHAASDREFGACLRRHVQPDRALLDHQASCWRHSMRSLFT